MSSAPAKKTNVPVQVHEKRGGQRATPAKFIPKKLPQSHKFAEGSQMEISSNLDNVTFMRLPEVKAFSGLGKTSIYGQIRNRSFPAPVRLGPRAVAWIRSEVMQWALERVHASRSVA